MSLISSIASYFTKPQKDAIEGWVKVACPEADAAIQHWKDRIPPKTIDFLRRTGKARYLVLHPHPDWQQGSGWFLWDASKEDDDGWVHSFPPNEGHLFVYVETDGGPVRTAPDETTLTPVPWEGAIRMLESLESESDIMEVGVCVLANIATLQSIRHGLPNISAEEYRKAYEGLMLSMHTKRVSTREALTPHVLDFLASFPHVEAICHEKPDDPTHATHVIDWDRVNGWIAVPSESDNIKVVMSGGGSVKSCQPLHIALEVLGYNPQSQYPKGRIYHPDWKNLPEGTDPLDGWRSEWDVDVREADTGDTFSFDL